MGVQTHCFRLKARQNVASAGTWGKGRVGLGPRYSTGNLFPLTRPHLPHCCHLDGPSHIPQIYWPMEYLTYSKHNRVPGKAGQPTIFTNTAKKEQKASEFHIGYGSRLQYGPNPVYPWIHLSCLGTTEGPECRTTWRIGANGDKQPKIIPEAGKWFSETLAS